MAETSGCNRDSKANWNPQESANTINHFSVFLSNKTHTIYRKKIWFDDGRGLSEVVINQSNLK